MPFTGPKICFGGSQYTYIYIHIYKSDVSFESVNKQVLKMIKEKRQVNYM